MGSGPEGSDLHFWAGSVLSWWSCCLSREQWQSQRGGSRSPVGAAGCAWAVPASQPQQQAVFNLLPLLWDWEQVSLCTHSSRAESQFLTALWWAPLVLKPVEGALLPGSRPKGWGAWYGAQTPHIFWRILEPVIFPSSSGLPARGVGPIKITSLPLLQDFIQFFLYCLDYRSHSASLQVVLSESCSTCSRSFDVFVQGGELSFLLLSHLDPTLLDFLINGTQIDLHGVFL